MLRDELHEIAAPMLETVKQHPFWSGMRDGTLPAAALWHYAEQDARYLLPSYARALARCAAFAGKDSHSALFAMAAGGSFEAATSMAEQLGKLAETLGEQRDLSTPAPIDPLTHAHTSFLIACTTDSFLAGVGGLLPMSLFHLYVSADLKERRAPGSRYTSWIDDYYPGDAYRGYVDMYLGMVDELGEQACAAERARLRDSFITGARYEWTFAEASWRQPSWAL